MADINPLRYRGYYQDWESGYYYLQSRYYDPAIGRFINADSYASTGEGFLGHDMFAYCGNDPVNSSDSTGAMRTYDAGGFAYSGGSASSHGSQGFTTLIAQALEALGLHSIAEGILLSTAATISAVTAVNELREDVIAMHQRERTEATVFARVEALSIGNDKPEKPQYWAATIAKPSNVVVPVVALSYKEARVWVATDGDLLCINRAAAFAIIKFYPSAVYEPAHHPGDPNYLNHYHLSGAHTNHIWFLGP